MRLVEDAVQRADRHFVLVRHDHRVDDVAAAANDPAGPREREPTSFILRDGWDPYEVWRTRVRDARTVLRPPEPLR